MLTLVNDQKIQQILNFPQGTGSHWQEDLDRFTTGDVTLDRKTAGENAVKGLQRLLIFLGYSTSSDGSYLIDGDFGRGTNRGLAQFMLENGLEAPGLTRDNLCYECRWDNASQRIINVGDVRLTVPVLEALLAKVAEITASGEVTCGSFEEAHFHLDRLHTRQYCDCKLILQKYGEHVKTAVARIAKERGIVIEPKWVLAVIRQESAGVVRPKFEQQWLSKLSRQNPKADLRELRYQSTSFGLGQVMGFNYQMVGAPSAYQMFISPIAEQVYYIARFVASKRPLLPVITKSNPSDADFHTFAKYYNGEQYFKHHYNESLERWFREFKSLNG